jgi:nondiscriminating glutamyl-tRNA synthetase
MTSEENLDEPIGVAANPFAAADVAQILCQRGWLATEPSPEQQAWFERAAALLRPHAVDHAGLESLLQLVFHYDAEEILRDVESHAVMSRYAARGVLRELALLLLDGGPLTIERFNEIVTKLKNDLEVRGRELFHPLRLALAGRVGEGELDRVILLLEEAANAGFTVKTARERILEFCASLE